VLRPPASRLVADENFVIDTARMRLIAAQLAHLRTELAEPAQLAALLGVSGLLDDWAVVALVGHTLSVPGSAGRQTPLR